MHEYIKDLRDVFINPYKFVNGQRMGGIAAECRNGLMLTSNGSRDKPLPPPDDTTPHHRISGKTLYSGPIWNHFGHILLDSIARLWAYKDHDNIAFALTHGLRGAHNDQEIDDWVPPSYFWDFMDILGIPREKIIIVKRATKFDYLEVPAPSTIWRLGTQPYARTFLRGVQEEMEYRARNIAVPSHIYYPRSHVIDDGGIIGSTYIEEYLLNENFAIVLPEKLSIVEQIAYALRSEVLAFDEGSAAHITELFDRTRSKFLMIPRRLDGHPLIKAIASHADLHKIENPKLTMLADRNGGTSPASLALYNEPDQIFQFLESKVSLRNRYDLKKYIDAEEHDIRRAKSKNIDIRKTRLKVHSDMRIEERSHILSKSADAEA